MSKRTTFICLAAATICLGHAATAEAATRRVCFRMELNDDRTAGTCPQPGASGLRYSCNQGAYTPMIGHRVELWDYDSDNGDEMIGTFVTYSTGLNCFTFEWENAAYSKGEKHPDVYVRYEFEVQATNGTGVIARARTTNGYAPAFIKFSPRADNCNYGSTCYLGGSSSTRLRPTTSLTSTRAICTMMLDTAQHALQAYGTYDTGTVDLWYPAEPDWCDGARACSPNQTDIYITAAGGARSGTLPAHEMGHNLKKIWWDTSYGAVDCSLGGDGHDIYSVEYESCGASEGWATYMAAAGWYLPWSATHPKVSGNIDIERAAPYYRDCSANKGVELQNAKAFWDATDSNNEGGAFPAEPYDDNSTMGHAEVVDAWKNFRSGTDNRERHESDINGPNVWDFVYNSGYTSYNRAALAASMLYHNCLQHQTTD